MKALENIDLIKVSINESCQIFFDCEAFVLESSSEIDNLHSSTFIPQKGL